MVRVPIGNRRSMRTEVRAVAPDANPVPGALLPSSRPASTERFRRRPICATADAICPDNIYTAIEDFKKSPWIAQILGADVQGRYADLKQAVADRSPRLLGNLRQGPEVQYTPRGLQPVALELVLELR